VPLLGIVASPDIWRFQPHPEVWVLVAGLASLYTYAIKVIGPRAVPAGQRVVRRRQVVCFIAGLTILWLASDWPLHDLSEEYLYSAHMLQHMMLSYFMPPLLLLATPTWLARLVVGHDRVWTAVRWLAKPVVAGVTFNAFVMISHVPAVVNHAVASGNGFLHYGLHTVLVLSALLMWTPVCGPFPELRMGPGGTMIYLFAMSVIPTVPAGWLTFADGVVYKAYDHGPRLWGISVTTDQQLAGAIMKVGGSFFLWVIITFLFFKRFMGRWEEQNTPRPVRRASAATAAGTVPAGQAHDADDEHVLTYEEVTRAFEATPPVPEPDRPTTG
jgi:putative membrane protein